MELGGGKGHPRGEALVDRSERKARKELGSSKETKRKQTKRKQTKRKQQIPHAPLRGGLE